MEVLPLRAFAGVERSGAAFRASAFDYVVGHAELLPLMYRLRAAGSLVPFAVVPDFNHVEGEPLLNLLLASQVAATGDILFTGSVAAAKSFGAFGFKTEPFYPLGIPTRYFTPAGDRRALRLGMGLPESAAVICYAGRLQADKAVLELIRSVGAVASQAECVLLVAYHIWDEDYRTECAAAADAAGCVRLIERPTMSRLRNIYRASDIFLSAAVSRYETFGRAVAEAMSCGAVPVAPDFDGFAETVGTDAGRLLPLEGPPDGRRCNLESLINVVTELVRSPAVVRSMSIRACCSCD